MKKETDKNFLTLQPVPKTIVSVRDKNGRNNALVVGFAANVSLDPAMVMVGIVPSRFSHHMVKENPCFVVNLPAKNFNKEYAYLGSKSGVDGDKFAALDLKWEDGKYVNAPVLTDWRKKGYGPACRTSCWKRAGILPITLKTVILGRSGWNCCSLRPICSTVTS